MTKRVIATWVAISLGFLAAAPAWATIGSVISSFRTPIVYGVLARYQYVYTSERYIGYDYLCTYNLSGSFVRRVQIDGYNPYGLISGSRTHLGPGYVALLDQNTGYLKIFSIATGGAPVTSFPVGTSLWNLFWDGEYYYVNPASGRGRFARYSRSGVSSGTWTCAGWPAIMTYCFGAEYAQRGNYGSGPYFVAGGAATNKPYCITTYPGGSLVKTWFLPSPYLRHMSYGDSSNPGVYGAAIWATAWTDVFEIDIDARGASAVLPTSKGKVKAIYR